MSEEQIQAGVQRLTGVVTANLGMPDMFVRLWRLLVDGGEPVTVARLAAAGGWPVEDVQVELDRQPGVDWDDDGRVAGFGLTLHPTPHAFSFDEKTVYGFCATDVVNFPAILGRAGVAQSTCPATGRPHPRRTDAGRGAERGPAGGRGVEGAPRRHRRERARPVRPRTFLQLARGRRRLAGTAPARRGRCYRRGVRGRASSGA